MLASGLPASITDGTEASFSASASGIAGVSTSRTATSRTLASRRPASGVVMRHWFVPGAHTFVPLVVAAQRYSDGQLQSSTQASVQKVCPVCVCTQMPDAHSSPLAHGSPVAPVPGIIIIVPDGSGTQRLPRLVRVQRKSLGHGLEVEQERVQKQADVLRSHTQLSPDAHETISEHAAPTVVPGEPLPVSRTPVSRTPASVDVLLEG